MRRYCLLVSLLLVIPHMVRGQIHEPLRLEMSQEEYMVMLIDSLDLSEAKKDTTNIIRFSSILTTQFQSARMPERALSYAKIALSHAKAFSDPTMLPEVCNRLGMLMMIFRGEEGSASYYQMMDSSKYWFQQAVDKSMQLSKFGTAGWGYRGLLSVSEKLHEYDGSKEDSITNYFENAIEMATKTDDEELIISSSSLYLGYLIRVNDWEKANPILEQQFASFNKMTTQQKLAHYVRLHDYLATKHDIDTLIAVKKLIFTYYQQVVAAGHDQALYDKDQQYEVSKTKNVLEETVSRLEFSNQGLIISTVVLLCLLIMTIWMYFLFRKNKKLSQRNELLLKEQNHRVKNNLQMISSLLSLQSQKLKSTDAKHALSESQSRINSVALLHRMLYEGEIIGMVETIDYIRSLTEEIQFSAGREMEIQLDLPQELHLNIDKVTSLGLIINELLTNSIKHVPIEKLLDVQFALSVLDDKIRLRYRDNGLGINFEKWKASKSFGNQLIQIQADQLHGKIDVMAEKGFVFNMIIPFR